MPPPDFEMSLDPTLGQKVARAVYKAFGTSVEISDAVGVALGTVFATLPSMSISIPTNGDYLLLFSTWVESNAGINPIFSAPPSNRSRAEISIFVNGIEVAPSRVAAGIATFSPPIPPPTGGTIRFADCLTTHNILTGAVTGDVVTGRARYVEEFGGVGIGWTAFDRGLAIVKVIL